MNCTECQDLFCKHRFQSSAGGQCFYESKEQMEKLLAVTTEATFAYIDWNTFRRDAAKDILAGFAGSVMRDDDILEDKTVKDLVKTAVVWADSLIKQLKEEK